MKRDFQEISKTWYLLANSIKILKDTRVQIEKSKNYDVLSINATLILTSAAVVEGAISSLLTHHLNSSNNYKQVKHKSDSEIERIYSDLLHQIQRAQWNEIKDRLFELITNYELQQIYKEDWEAIDVLFNFRNLLAHGGMIIRKVEKISDAENVEEIQNEERIEKHSRKKLFEYLEKKNLVDRNEKNHILRWQYIGSNVTDHFVDHAKKFLEKVFDRYLQNFESNNTLKQDIEAVNMM